MRILAIPGSIRRDSHNARLLRHAAERAPDGSRDRALRRPEVDPALRRGRRCRARPGAGRRPAPGGRRGRRDPDRHPRIQLLDPGGAKERDRLGLAPARRDPASEQARRGDRRLDRPVRRRLGAGRDAQGARPRPAPGSSTSTFRSPRRTRRSMTTTCSSIADHHARLDEVIARPRRDDPRARPLAEANRSPPSAAHHPRAATMAAWRTSRSSSRSCSSRSPG